MLALVFDTETTGLLDNGTIREDRRPEIIEYSGVIVDLATGETGVPLNLIIKPKRELPQETIDITGLTADMLKDAPPFSEVADQIISQIERAPMVLAHNLSYDKEMVDLEASRLGRAIKWPLGLCTVEQTVFLKGFRLSQSDLCELLTGERMKEAHRAAIDVNALVRISIELYKRGCL